jgi:hypothetical protein
MRIKSLQVNKETVVNHRTNKELLEGQNQTVLGRLVGESVWFAAGHLRLVHAVIISW